MFLRLGLTSFGGPVAHLGYFHREFVERRAWCAEAVFAELVAMAQSLPGPASSQVAFTLGLLRAGLAGGIAAWLGFTMPSALLMLALAAGHAVLVGKRMAGVVHGLQLAAVAVVAQAVLAMRGKLAPDAVRMVFALVAMSVALIAPPAFATFLAIVLGGVLGLLFLKPGEAAAAGGFDTGTSKRASIVAGACFAILLIGLPLAGAGSGSMALAVFNSFYRAGALVFGGGHVVLPLLEGTVVAKGWVDQQTFLAGYGAAQALPGPLFTFAAYLGASIRPSPSSIVFGMLALIAIFLPGLLSVTFVVPIWNQLRSKRVIQTSLTGVNASVVGVLMAALYRPVWTATVRSPVDVVIAGLGFVLLVVFKLPAWLVVVGAGFVCAIVNG